MTVTKKIALTCALLVVASLLQVGLALHTLSKIRADVAAMNREAVEGMVTSSKILQEFTTLRLNHMRHIIEQDPAKMDIIQSGFEADTAHLRNEIRQAAQSSASEEDRKAYASIGETLDLNLQQWQSVQALSRADKTAEAMDVYAQKVAPTGLVLNKKVTDLDARKLQEERSLSAAVDASAARSYFVLCVLCLGATLCGVVAAFLIVRGINAVLRGSIFDLANASRQIAAAATQVSESSQSLAQGASEQAATVQETSSASSEINSMAQRNTENSRSVSEVVSHSQDRVEHTSQSLDEMVVAMDGITSSSQKISKIIKVIDEIAFQTNILALNAAVEAARAGEAGMGFAVVADEVRNLAQRSAQAAKDTSSLIEESIQQSSGGKAKVDRVAEEFRAIAAESSRMKTLIDEINSGSVEQSRGIDQISRSLSQIDQVVQSSAANAEETASAAEELQTQAESMQEVVGTLARMIDGDGLVQAKEPLRVRKVAATLKTAVKATVTPVARNTSAPKFASPGSDSFPMDDDFKAF